MAALLVGSGGIESQLHELYAQAKAARSQSRALVARHRAVQQSNVATLERIHATWDRAEKINALWLADRPGRLRYSACARLQARLDTMPIIEQAKGIIMAQCGWPEDQAFDALRQASQRRNIKVRDLATLIVAKTASSTPGQQQDAG